MPVRGRTPVLRLVAAAGLLAAGLAFTPGRAAAECGDYVRIAGQPMAPHGGPGQADHGQPTPGKPCHGPGCSGHQTTPVPVTAPVTGPGGSKEWAARFGADLDAAATGRTLPPLTSEDGSVSRPASIFHPPRGG
ncbi:MAG: hypothetical protein K2X87_03845 [Gemmataceae bacterium]|nr:hypothetical protein [Gemmataceae bacterium]